MPRLWRTLRTWRIPSSLFASARRSPSSSTGGQSSMSKRQRTVGQETGIESNPVAPDNRNGQLDSAGVGNQSTHESPGMVVPVVTSSRLNQARLRQALSSIGQASDAVQSLFSGPTSGRTSEQDTVESSDSRERSEERRVGKECKSGRSPYREK